MAERDSNQVSWGRVGRAAGLVAGIGLLVQTLLFLVDALGLITEAPGYLSTAAGKEQDLANYFTAFFEHQHDVVWDIVIRDVLGPIAYLALGILAIALTRVLGRDRPDVVLTATLLQVGAAVAALSDLVYLGTVGIWRMTGFTATPPADIIGSGRAYEQIEHISDYLQYAGFAVLAVALALLARLCIRNLAMPTRLGWLAAVEGLALAGLVTSSVSGASTVFDVLALLTGVLLGPAVVIWTGLAIQRSARAGVVAEDPFAGHPARGADDAAARVGA